MRKTFKWNKNLIIDMFYLFSQKLEVCGGEIHRCNKQAIDEGT